MHISIKSTLISLAFGAIATAQDLTVTAPAQDKAIAIVNATIHPIVGEPIVNGHIVFDKGRIIQIGEGVFDDGGVGRIINASGKHIYPGLIGAVTRLGLDEISSVRASRDYDEAGSVTPEAYAAVAVNPDSTLLPVTRSNGVLVVGSFPSGGRISGRASVLRLEGWTWEDMTIDPHAGLVVNWPRARPIRAWWMDQSEAQQARDIQRDIDQIEDLFASAEDYLRAREADADHPVDIRWEAMRDIFPAAGSAQAPVFINANDVDQITTAVAWAAKRDLRAVIVGGRDAYLVADLLIANDVPVILSGTHNLPKRGDHPFDHAFTLPSRLEAAGVTWAMASGEETAHERSLAYNAAKAVAYGLDHEVALRSITLAPAQILGIGDDYGHLSEGASATLIVTDGTPLEITTHVHWAFIDGREIDLSNKQTILNDKYREKYRQLDLID